MRPSTQQRHRGSMVALGKYCIVFPFFTIFFHNATYDTPDQSTMRAPTPHDHVNTMFRLPFRLGEERRQHYHERIYGPGLRQRAHADVSMSHYGLYFMPRLGMASLQKKMRISFHCNSNFAAARRGEVGKPSAASGRRPASPYFFAARPARRAAAAIVCASF